MIEAAGGLVVRWAMRERAEVLLVHRPGRDDWTFPKGKRRRSESAADCALREVHEETGLCCELGRELPSTAYRDRKGRAKRVRYWAMSRFAGEFAPNREVDEVRWVRLERVGELLTYERDLVVAAALGDRSALVG